MAALAGLAVLVPESRELDLFATLLAAEGAIPVRCPLVKIADLEDTTEADRWIERMIAEPFDFTVLLTGEGLRKLRVLAGPRERALIGALGKTRLVVRGPKPIRALREIGLTPSLQAAQPTSAGVLETLEKERLKNRRIGAQLYPGDGARFLVDALTAHGAEVFPVTPYRYATGIEDAAVADTIRALADGKFGLVAFTASAQLDRLFTVAREAGLMPQLTAGLARTPIAAVGPVMEKALADHGLRSVVQPAINFHLKPLVRAIITWRRP